MTFPLSGAAATTRHAFLSDHLGSIVGVVNAAGDLIERSSYDPWGHARDPETGALLASMPERMADRGFTGHEELPHLDLVHMNGRIYDPLATRFLSPDPFVQFPEFDQSWNRYSYVLNNPLTFTDPSGYFIQALVVAVVQVAKIIAAVVSVVSAAYSFYQTLAAGGSLSDAITGAVLSAASMYVASLIGAAFNPAITAATSFLERGFYQLCSAAMHGLSQGAFTAAQKGDFKDGFTGTFVSKMSMSLAFETKAMQSVFGQPGDGTLRIIPRTITATLIGGTASKIGGGKFASGAASAAVSWMFNSEGGRFRRAIDATRRFIGADPSGGFLGSSLTIKEAGASFLNGALEPSLSYWENAISNPSAHTPGRWVVDVVEGRGCPSHC